MAEKPEQIAQSPTKRRTPRWKIVLVVVLLVGCVAASVLFYWNVTLPAQELARVIQEIDASDPGWRYADLLRQLEAQVPPDSKNGALVVTKGVGLMQNNLYFGGNWSVLQEVEFFGSLQPNRKLNPGNLEILLDQVHPNREALKEILKAADMPQGLYPIIVIKERKDLVNAPLLTYYSDRARALLRREALLSIQDRDEQKILSCVYALVRCGQYIGDSPGFVHQVLRLSCFCDAASTLEHALGVSTVDANKLTPFQELFLNEAERNAFAISMRGDRACMDELLQLVELGEIDFKRLYSGPRNGTVFQEFVDTYLAGYLRESPTKMRLRLLNHYNLLLKFATLDPHECHRAVKQYHASVPTGSVSSLLIRINPEPYLSARQALLSCAAVGIAVERFRIRHGRWPNDLDELVPDFLDRVPRDCFTGNPLRYRVTSEGVIIWSVGPDGVDEGGSVQCWATEVGVPKKDIGFRLYNPDHRNLPPPTEPDSDNRTRPSP
ncbi:MAG: hypothetical protein NZM31_03110 [Gemmatales bacterium]|nr:hypothetical protein [Gemmatales bacterium]MDW8385990.1 hypothetical protein [Gemmatales bacterium]